MTPEMRRMIERTIAKRVIANALMAGYVISVHDGEEITVERSDDAKAILEAMMTTDEDWLLLHRPGERDHFGWVRFIYGNDGFDVMADYTTNLEEPIMADVNRLIDQLETRWG